MSLEHALLTAEKSHIGLKDVPSVNMLLSCTWTAPWF